MGKLHAKASGLAVVPARIGDSKESLREELSWGRLGKEGESRLGHCGFLEPHPSSAN